MRSLLIGAALAACLLAALPTLAAQTYKVPITIVPGSVTFQGTGDYTPSGNPAPATFPISRQLFGNTAGGACSIGLVTVEANIVDGGFEAGVNGYAAGSGCTLGGEIVFDVEIQVPEMGGTTTAVRLVPEVQEFDFLDYARVGVILGSEIGTTSSIPDFAFATSLSAPLDWNGTSDPGAPPTTPTGGSVSMMHWVPGDTLRFTVRATVFMRGDPVNPAQGNVRTRWEFRVTVPEPSASLSIPVGVLALFGFAALRG